LFSSPVFPKGGERSDELPLPEDYLVRGLVWAHDYFPEKWFERKHDEEERYLELASTVKSRMERVLRLGHELAIVVLQTVTRSTLLTMLRSLTAGCYTTANLIRFQSSLICLVMLKLPALPGLGFGKANANDSFVALDTHCGMLAR
tara:strand:- start:286 stop:723 length:438 start_codon:yes stop_codon:yes gene_type:complete